MQLDTSELTDLSTAGLTPQPVPPSFLTMRAPPFLRVPVTPWGRIHSWGHHLHPAPCCAVSCRAGDSSSLITRSLVPSPRSGSLL